MAQFTMPALGADMVTGKVVEWLVKPGDRVKPGDVVAVVETHKGAIDVECFLEGVIDELVALGEELPVGAVLAQVRAPGEVAVAPAAAAKAAPPAAPAVPAAAPAPTAPAKPELPSAPPEGQRARVSPAARRRAQALGLDADRLHGTGVDGAVTLADVELAAAQPRAPVVAARAPPPKGGFDPAQMRQAIAAAMGRSKREIPHYYLSSTIDFDAAQRWL